MRKGSGALPDSSTQGYLDSLLASTPEEVIFIQRKLILDDKWRERASDNAFRFSGILREYEPDLYKVLTQQNAVIVGEPGSGKSTIARVAVRYFASQRSNSSIPILVNLRSYRGSLPEMLQIQIPSEILHDPHLTRKYVLDATDEIPRDCLANFAQDLKALLNTDKAAGCFMTSRQAFYAAHREYIGFDAPVYHLLDFDEEDLRDYARQRGLEPQKFLNAVYEAEINSEVSNPLIAKVTTERLLQNRPLSRLRSENIGFMVDQLLSLRPLSEPLRSRRAAQLLAVGMETYARNELSIEEAVQILIAGLGLDDVKALDLMEELFQSILIRTPGGISFQLNSYGEFLAAYELRNQTFDRIQRLSFFDDGTPNDSWSNTISLLAEMHNDVRRFFTRNYPEWMTQSSPHAFTEEERTSVVDGVVGRLDDAGQFLLGHPTIRPYNIARFLTGRNLDQLKRNLDSTRPEIQGNALVLLGIAKETEVISRALDLVKTIGRADSLRYCAVIALLSSSKPELIDELIPVLDFKDPYRDSVLECIGTLMTENDFERVLPLLLTTQTMLSSVYGHVRNLRTRGALVNVLRLLIKKTEILQKSRAEAYLEPAISVIPEYADGEVVQLLADLLLATENKVMFDEGRLFKKIVQGIDRAGCQGAVCEIVLRDLVNNGSEPRINGRLIASWLDLSTANFLIEENATRIIQRLSPYIQPGPVREILEPYSAGHIRAQDENAERYLAESAERQLANANDLANKQRIIVEADELSRVESTLSELNEESWPTLIQERKDWLAKQLSDRLEHLDLEHSIVRNADSSWQQPGELPALLRVIDHYALKIAKDDALVLALLAWPEQAISNYFSRNGFTDAARDKFTELFNVKGQHPAVIDNLVVFLVRTEFGWPCLTETLMQVATATHPMGYVQVNAVAVLAKHNAPDGNFVELLKSPSKGVRESAFNVLISRQHRATIERELSRLIDDSSALRAGEVSFPNVTPYNWIGSIVSPWAWEKLKALRRKTLLLELPYLSGTVTETMKKLNPQELTKVVEEQIKDSPAAWVQVQKKLLIDYRRQARLLMAQQTPFVRVLAKLKVSTSILTIKMWVEGITDLPIFRKLLQDMGLVELAETLDIVGGWPMLLTRPPQRWSDGCREAVIVMDGDVGRDLRSRRKAHTKEAKRAFERLKDVPVRLYVLERYGIENYFPCAALEKALLRDLGAYFPLPDDIGIQRHLIENKGLLIKIFSVLRKWFGFSFTIERPSFYQKSLSSAVAENMTLRDISGTDLENILNQIKARVEELVV